MSVAVRTPLLASMATEQSPSMANTALCPANTGVYARFSRPAIRWSIAALLPMVACQAETPAPASETGGFSLQVGALSGACGGTPSQNPFGGISTLKLVIREPQTDGTMKETYSVTSGFSPSVRTATFDNIPAKQVEVTLEGLNAAAKPLWFARKSNVVVPKTAVTPLDLIMMAVEGFTCMPAANHGAVPNSVFSAVTRISNGQLLITGGFQHADASSDDKEWLLGSPSKLAYIFDPGKGTFRQLDTTMVEGRGGHSAIYLAKSNKVLIVGGALKMHVAKAGGTPPTWLAQEATNSPFEVFDVNTEKFIAGEGVENGHKRVMPTLMPLSNDLIAIVGGGPWPLTDDNAYMKADLYDPSAGNGGNGAFVDSKGQLALNAPRSGSALAYVGATAAGTSRYLVWGGNALHDVQEIDSSGATTPKGVQPGAIAERFRESTELGVGQFADDFVLDNKDFDTSKPLYFPSLTSIGSARDAKGNALDDGRLLSVGGVRYDPTAGKWLDPDKDDVWLLTLTESTETAKGRIKIERVSGLAAGIYMHQTGLAGKNVVVAGGFSSLTQPASFTLQAFDITNRVWRPATATPAATHFVPRGGLASLPVQTPMNNDCMMLFGGVASFADLASTAPTISDIYCSQLLLP